MTAPDLLYPLTLFCEDGGHPLPSFEVIESTAIPEPYRGLLAHDGDMTSRLEAFHRGAIVLEIINREYDATEYRREVVLHVADNGLAVEYGAIAINLDRFPDDVRAKILEGHLPLGGLLNQAGIKYCSRPKAFIKLGPDPVMQRVFGTQDAREFFGRCNQLLGEGNEELARIVEVVRPASLPA